ncbi:hypothetical protein MUO14_16565 [Halobacillus shinanisalinarum]|uniref:Uncharacterized protein n=1 Tax=Halobacillus shinanisalinarum TaxID=2932258 RepID=A0ABY4GVA1_9BACI|nr:hypothetical protein [Halobacillus shinanisalinarum]UOQ92097.1 hypothetical protein MUO14_16565 [Halobacillus shinanisalinarum]
MSIQAINIKDKQQSRQLEIRRMTIYKQSKIIEAADEQGQIYYIFFHEDQYLNYVTSKKITKRSYVKDAFEKGVTLPPPHPLIEIVVSSYPHFKKQNFNELFKKLQQQYSFQETALIASYFESFIKKDKLADFIKTLFYKDRRDGKLLSCYRILHILKDFAPNHSLVSAFSGDLQFTKYDERYKHGDETFLAKDPIYVERKLYSNKHHELSFQKLMSLYKEQSRWIDMIAMYITRVVHTQTSNDYYILHSLIDEHFISMNRLRLLEDLYTRGLEVEPLRQDLLNLYMEEEKLEEVLTFIGKHELTLQPSQSQRLIKIVKQQEITANATPPEGLRKLIVALFESKDDQAADFLHQAITSLLNERGLPYIQEWAQPLRDISLANPILQKVDEMNRLIEDPSEQRRLGELYHYFHNPEQAIECMSWDMELREEDPEPVQWLAKLYHELGMDEEYKAYQQLYIDMVKRA